MGRTLRSVGTTAATSTLAALSLLASGLPAFAAATPPTAHSASAAVGPAQPKPHYVAPMAPLTQGTGHYTPPVDTGVPHAASSPPPRGGSAPAPPADTDHSHTVRHADGSYTSDITTGPTRFKDAGGQWHDIDLALTDDGNGTLKAKRAEHAHRLAKTAKGAVVTLDTAAGQLSVSHPDATDAPARSVTSGPEKGHGARYPGGLSKGRDLQEAFVVGGVEETVTLPNAAAGASYQVRVSLPEGLSARSDDTGVQFVDASGAIVAEASGGVAEDSAGAGDGPGAQAPVRTALTTTTGRIASLTISIDPSWLADPARVFPVIVDPLYFDRETTDGPTCLPYGPTDPFTSCDTYVNSDNYDASPGYYAQTQLRSGSPGARDQYLNDTNATRTYLRFPTDNIGTGSFTNYTVTSATIFLASFGGQPYNRYTNLFGSAGTINAATNWRNQPGIDGLGAARSLFTGGQGWVGWDVTALAGRWFSGAEPNRGAALVADNERDPSYFRQYYSAEDGAGVAPKLHVEYVTAPDAPTNVVASAAEGQLTATWTAVPPDRSGGAPLDFYVAYLYDAGSYTGRYAQVCATCTAASFTGLSDGHSYRVDVYAHNNNLSPPAAYYSAAAPSNTVTPQVSAPTITKTAATAAGPITAGSVLGAGQQVTYTLRVTNPSGGGGQSVSVTDQPGPGLAVPSSLGVLVDQLACAGGVICTVDPATGGISVSGLAIPAGGARTISYTALLADLSKRSCAPAANTARVTGPTGVATAVFSVLGCDSALGLEPWWSYAAHTTTGPQGVAQVNVANGNLVLQQLDSTPVPAHGHLSYALRRTYNSEDSTAVTLPGSIGAGWVLNLGEAGEGVGQGLSPTALVVPSLATAAQPLAIALIDRDGTRHLFSPKATTLSTPLLTVGSDGSGGLTLVPALGALRALVPDLLGGALDLTRYTAVCLDTSYTAPPGVHLGLWRYLATTTGGCTGLSSANAVVLGFATERPDRLRSEYSWDGHLLAQTDGAGVALRYLYGGGLPLLPAPSAGYTPPPLGALSQVYEPRSCADPAAATCRAIRFSYPSPSTTTVTDPAGRATTYTFDGPLTLAKHLLSVTNPDGSVLRYTYSGVAGTPACGPTPGQLCSATDPRGTPTRFSYAAAPAGPARVATLTDRRGTATTFSYAADASFTTATQGSGPGRVQTFSGIDELGRVGELADSDTTGVLYHDTRYRWDTTAAPCRVPDAVVDNELCGLTRAQTSTARGAAPAQSTNFTYNPDGMTLSSAAANSSGATGGFDTTTTGYHVSYVHPDGSITGVDDAVTGGGVVTPGSRSGTADALYSVDDKVALLPPRGNAAGAAFPAYESTWTIDNLATAVPNAVPSAAVCTAAGEPTANTGAVCASSGPVFDNRTDGSGTHPVTRYRYDVFGATTSMTTPRGGVYSYAYFADTALELSGSVSAGGWLASVTDPSGHFVAFGDDRAGGVARSWDRGATARAGLPASAYPGTLAAPPSPEYAETLRAPGGASAAVAAPWRYVASTRDPLGNIASSCLDPDGNPLLTRPPRGSTGTAIADCAGALAAPGRYDVLFDTATGGAAAPDDRTTSVLAPAEARRNGASADAPTLTSYNSFGEVAAVTDPRGQVRVTDYDGAGRAVGTRWTRGAFAPARAGGTPPADPDCAPGTQTTSADAPLPTGRIVCRTSTGYDGLDNPTATQDGAGATTSHSYDALGRPTSTLTPPRPVVTNQATGATATLSPRTDTRYDADGNPTDVCGPREFTEGAGTCTATGRFSTHSSVDPAGQVVTVTRYRQASVGDVGTAGAFDALRSQSGYDADGNAVSATDPNGHTTTAAFDLLDRRTGQTVPRDASSANTTSWAYDPVGDILATTAPPGTDGVPRITATSFDADNRLLDTVTGADATDAAAAGLPGADGGTNVRTRRAYDADGNVVATFEPRAFTTSVTAPDPRLMTRVEFDLDARPVARFTPRYAAATPDPALAPEQSAQCTTGNRPDPVSGVADYPPDTGVCVTRLTYDGAGNVLREQLPTSTGSDNRYLAATYTDDDLPASQDAPSPARPGARVATTTSYDGAARPVAVSDPLGHVSTTAYFPDATVASRSTPPGPSGTHTTTMGYDASGAPATVTDPLGQIARTRYYADGAPAEEIDPGSNTTRYGYDATGNPTTVLSPSALAHDATNPGGVATTNAYTFDDLLAATITPIAGDGTTARRVDRGYDGAGRPTTTHSYEIAVPAGLDPRSVTTPSPGRDGGSQTTSYYPNDRVATQTGRDGSTIATGYDAAGHRATVTDSTGGESTITASYYLDGLPASVTDGAAATGGHTVAYAYDGLGQPVARADTLAGVPPTPASTTTATYTDAESLATSTDPALSAAPVSFGYDADGRQVSQTNPNATTVASVFADDDTLAAQTLSGPSSSGGPLASWSYSYDANARVTTQDFIGVPALGGPGAGLATGISRYSYDGANRLASYTAPSGPTKAIGYDHDGNRTSYGATSFSYHADDTIATVTDSGTDPATPPRTQTYTPFGALSSDGCAAYGYDGFDRLATVATQAGAPANCPPPASASYSYDGLDRQRTHQSSQATTLGATSVPANVATTVHYAGLSTAISTESIGGSVGDLAQVHYQLGPDGTPLAVGTATPADAEYLSSDGQGDITTATSAAGLVACTARFDPYGTPLNAAPSGQSPCDTGASVNDVFYQGARRDQASGTYQLGARTYDPSRASFLTPDSYRGADSATNLGVGVDPLTRNTYSYVNGDPINLTDPSGHFGCWRFSCVRDAATTTYHALTSAARSLYRGANDFVGFDPARLASDFIAAFGQFADAATKVASATAHATATAAHATAHAATVAATAVGHAAQYCVGSGARTCAAIAGGVALVATGVGALADVALAGGLATGAVLGSSALSAVSFAHTGSPLDLAGVVPGIGLAGRAATELRAGAEAAQGLRAGAAGLRAVTAATGVAEEAGVGGTVAGAAAEDARDVRNAAGIVYRRTDAAGGKPYIGQTKSAARFGARQEEHARANPSADFEYEIVGRANPGIELDRLEEFFIRIRQEGGPTNPNNPDGWLANLRHQMNGARYQDAGGDYGP